MTVAPCTTGKKFIVCFNFTLKDQNIRSRHDDMSIVGGMMICLTLFFSVMHKTYYEWPKPYENTEKARVMFIESEPPGSY